jgi:hypothetical protein
MGNLETDLVVIEMGLESEDFTRVFRGLDKLRSKYPSYENERAGYLIDYYTGQALFRSEVKSRMKIKKFIRARNYLKTSIRMESQFSDSHLLVGYISIFISKHEKCRDNKYFLFESRYHLKKAVELNPRLSDELDSKLALLDETLYQVPDVFLCSIHEDMVIEWMIEFEPYPWVTVIHTDILDQKVDAVVSPANSFGFMDGGLDYQ